MEAVEHLLPAEVLQKASVKGSEYAWSFDDVPAVIAAARRCGLATEGGQVQYRFPNATCELYWLNADSTPRRDGEVWSEYVVRSADEVLGGFQRLLADTDFIAEVAGLGYLAEQLAPGVSITPFRCFVLYFASESA
jgi:hypothetical protein